MSKRTEIEEDHSITDILCRVFHCQCESRGGKVLEIVFYLVIQVTVFYWIVIPVLSFIDKVFNVLAGSG